MLLGDVLGTTRAAATAGAMRAQGTAEVAADRLQEASAVIATGQAPKGASSPAATAPMGSPATTVAMLALASLGGIVAMRYAFKGAIS